jgi:hypothetical protein
VLYRCVGRRRPPSLAIFPLLRWRLASAVAADLGEPPRQRFTQLSAPFAATDLNGWRDLSLVTSRIRGISREADNPTPVQTQTSADTFSQVPDSLHRL